MPKKEKEITQTYDNLAPYNHKLVDQAIEMRHRACHYRDMHADFVRALIPHFRSELTQEALTTILDITITLSHHNITNFRNHIPFEVAQTFRVYAQRCDEEPEFYNELLDIFESLPATFKEEVLEPLQSYMTTPTPPSR